MCVCIKNHENVNMENIDHNHNAYWDPPPPHVPHMYTAGPSTAATVTAVLQVTSIFFQFRLGELVYLQLKFTLFTFPAFTPSCVCDHLLDISLIRRSVLFESTIPVIGVSSYWECPNRSGPSFPESKGWRYVQRHS